MSKEMHEKEWQLSQERANQFWEYLNQTLNLNIWNIIIKSTGEQVQLEEVVKQYSNILSNPYSKEYQPNRIAKDALDILIFVIHKFLEIRTTGDEVVKTTLMNVEKMSSYIEKFEGEAEIAIKNAEELQVENDRLKALLDEANEKIEMKNNLLRPILDMMDNSFKNLLEVHEKFKDEEDKEAVAKLYDGMTKVTKKLLEVMIAQVKSGKIDYTCYVKGIEEDAKPQDKEEQKQEKDTTPNFKEGLDDYKNEPEDNFTDMDYKEMAEKNLSKKNIPKSDYKKELDKEMLKLRMQNEK